MSNLHKMVSLRIQCEPGHNLKPPPCSLTLPVDNLLMFCQNCLPFPVLKGPELEHLLNDPDSSFPYPAEELNKSDTDSPLSVSSPKS